MRKLDDIKGKIKVEAVIGLFVLVAVVAGGFFFLTGSAINDTQVATVPPAVPPAEENTTLEEEAQSALPGSGLAYRWVPVYGSNPNYIDLDQFEVPGKESQRSGNGEKQDSGVITPVDQHDDDGDDLWDFPEAEEEVLDPEDIELPGDDGFPDDLFPEENPDEETETPDVETPDDIGEVEEPDPLDDEDEFPEETPDDMPDDDWIDDWIND